VDYSSFSYYVHIVVDLVFFLFIFSVTIFYMDAPRGNQLSSLSGLASLNKVCIYVYIYVYIYIRTVVAYVYASN
jgi:hypothetical protein